MVSKSKQLPQLKFFISGIDTLVGKAVFEQVRNDHTNSVNPHQIFGSKYDETSTVSSGVKKVIKAADYSVRTKTILDSDVIIYDLNTADHEEVELTIKTLKMENYNTEKILILISSVMSWSNTPPKEKKEGDEEEEEIGEPEEGEEEEQEQEQEQEPEEPPQLDENGEEIPKKVYVAYKEKDYERRKPISKYERFKSLETLCLSAQNSKPNFLGYVLCSGVLYGNGEEVFAEHFKQAWLQDPQALSYIGDGKNWIPTIHVKDLAMFVNFVVNKKPATRYIFAIDHSRKPILKKHIETISKGLGTGKIKSVPVEEADKDPALGPHLDVFKLNIKLQPSKVMETGEGEEEEEQEEEPAEGEEGEENAEKIKIPKFKFVWYCKGGIKRNIAKIVEEYNTNRGLKPIKIFITGPPASGKSFFGAQLSKHYNIPRILVADVAKEVADLQTEFGEEVRTALQEVRDNMVREAEEKLEAEGKTDVTVDPETLFPRLPEEFLIKAYKYRLEKNDCFNRGFVIDGFPRSYEQAKGVFLTPAPPKEGEDVDPDNPVLIIDERKVPEFVIKLEATDEFLENRVKMLPEEDVEGTHFNEEGMVRRLKEYRRQNVSVGGNSVLSTFFDENSIEILRLNCEKLTNKELFNAMRVFIERKEKFKNYQDAEDKEEVKRVEEIKKKEEEKKKVVEIKKTEEEKKEVERINLQAEVARLIMEQNKQKENQLLNEKSHPLRQYLAEQIRPILTQGIIEICKKDPKDPVDFLAEYLFQASLSVKQPDPGKPAK